MLCDRPTHYCSVFGDGGVYLLLGVAAALWVSGLESVWYSGLCVMTGDIHGANPTLFLFSLLQLFSLTVVPGGKQESPIRLLRSQESSRGQIKSPDPQHNLYKNNIHYFCPKQIQNKWKNIAFIIFGKVMELTWYRAAGKIQMKLHHLHQLWTDFTLTQPIALSQRNFMLFYSKSSLRLTKQWYDLIIDV